MSPAFYLRVLRAEAGAEQRNLLNDAPQRFNGQPGFLLEPDAAECHPFGMGFLRAADRQAQLPSGPLFYCFDGRDATLTEWAVDITSAVADACRCTESLAVMATHSCLSEDVSTCLSSGVIDQLGLTAQHSLTVIGELGSAWAQAVECAQALQFGDGSAATTLLLAGEKWRAPFHRHCGDLFALSDGMAAVLVGAQAPAGGRSIAVGGCASVASTLDAPWLHAPVPVNAMAWAAAVELGLAHLEARLGIDLRESRGACLGPTLGMAAGDLCGAAPRLAALINRQTRRGCAALAGHFGAADPFIRLDAWLRDDPAAARGAPVIAWSAGPGGDVSVLHGVATA
jgi:hypothetical protein